MRSAICCQRKAFIWYSGVFAHGNSPSDTHLIYAKSLGVGVAHSDYLMSSIKMFACAFHYKINQTRAVWLQMPFLPFHYLQHFPRNFSCIFSSAPLHILLQYCLRVDEKWGWVLCGVFFCHAFALEKKRAKERQGICCWSSMMVKKIHGAFPRTTENSLVSGVEIAWHAYNPLIGGRSLTLGVEWYLIGFSPFEKIIRGNYFVGFEQISHHNAQYTSNCGIQKEFLYSEVGLSSTQYDEKDFFVSISSLRFVNWPGI